MDMEITVAIIALIGVVVTAIIGPIVVEKYKRRPSVDPDDESIQQHQSSPTLEPESGTETLAQEQTLKVNLNRVFEGLDPDVFGRKQQLRQLDQAWDDDEINIVSLVASGGVGKSALINQWQLSLGEDYGGAS